MAAADIRDERSGAVAAERAARDIVARRERLTEPGNDNDANGVVHLRFGKDLDEVSLQALRHAVEAVGLVERYEPDARVV